MERANRATQLKVRTDLMERGGFERAAELTGVSLSAWVRGVLREAAERRLAVSGERPGWL